MVEVYGQVSLDGRRWAALVVAAAVLAGCGSVGLEADDAGADAHQDAARELQGAAGSAAGTTGAAGTGAASVSGGAGTGAAGSSSPDARGDAPPSSTPCSAATYRDVCVNYTDRRACLVGCKSADGQAWPQAGKSCTGTVPFFDDVIPVCVASCGDCPREL